jgi:hypothetical protein
MDSDRIMLPEHEALLARLVSVDRNLPRDRQETFFFHQAFSGDAWARHPSAPDIRIPVQKGDIDVLSRRGFIRLSYAGNAIWVFDITPEGAAYYEQMAKRPADSVQQVEAEVRRFLDADDFRRRYLEACRHWSEATTRLWSADTETEWQAVGQLCGEAMREFAAELIEHFQPLESDERPADPVEMVRYVIGLETQRLDYAENAFLHALAAY